MTLDLAPAPAASAHYRKSARPEILKDIQAPGVNLCIWERQSHTSWKMAIRSILCHPNALNLDLTAPTVARIVDFIGSMICPDAKLERSVSSLAMDVFDLAARFAAISGIRHPRVRLTRVEDTGCALFHADTLFFRLLCTYAGPGTQWLENGNVRRDQLGSHGRSLEAANNAIVIDPLQIREMPTSHVAVFKGRKANGEENNAWIHRSFPVLHAGDVRLRLCIDLPDSCTC